MNKIIRWYNQNRKIVWTSIVVIIGMIGLIQTLNNYYKNNTKEESSSTNISTTTYNNPNYSVVTETEINETISKNSQNIIKEFFNYCNSGKIEQAYNLLSDDCKEELYPNIDIFKDQYYNRIFTESKIYDSTLWFSNGNKNTYRLEITGDILATGSKETMPIEDYYTVIYKDKKYSLSISRYIGKQEINISQTKDNITVKVLNQKSYIDYEKYEIRVKNGTQGNIIFNTKQNINSMYLQDENNLKDIAFLNEISEYDLEISRGVTKTYDIKFNRIYNPKVDIEKIVFTDISISGKIISLEIDV